MSVSSHVQELRRKHQALSAEVEQAQRAPASDPLEIARMKKRKLALKEEISRLS
ncbi:YdcH family protein [Tropicimonas sp. IMCC34011]|uniref:YdcH family protein n=1 Tax=Tropicimonas sp. IMCC34011 TaxID=2248759 RepID=UPI000E23E781|nr:YdcH family protein [Tropicimonas sp. IMCC34011]